jgi:hypothetical protein
MCPQISPIQSYPGSGGAVFFFKKEKKKMNEIAI